jgi:hypothetical protein
LADWRGQPRSCGEAKEGQENRGDWGGRAGPGKKVSKEDEEADKEVATGFPTWKSLVTLTCSISRAVVGMDAQVE